MAREIRNTIAFPFYDDLDFHNCHPTLLMQRCQREGIACPHLDEYCRRRESVLKSLGETDNGKAAVLAVINGGSGDAKDRSLHSCLPDGELWLRAFAEEMRFIRERLVQCEPVYLKIAQTQSTPNVLGSALNLLLCDLENDALSALREYIETTLRKRVGVLVFDGCMVEKGEASDASSSDSSTSESTFSDQSLVAASDFIFERTGYRLNIRVKNMAADKLDVPMSVYQSLGRLSNPTMPVHFAEDDVSAGRAFLADLGDSVTSCNAEVWIRNGPLWVNNPAMVRKLMTTRCMSSNIFCVSDRGEVTTMVGR
jgi:hypothetical protein